MDFFQDLALNAKRVREKYNMSHPVNNSIGEEIADMIVQMRPDLSEEEASECWYKCWNSLPESPMWYTNVRQIIATFNRGQEVIH